MTKCEFIENELISSSIEDAFQVRRENARVYAHGVAEQDNRRKDLKSELAALLRRIGTQYVNTVIPNKHNQNIKKIADDLRTQFGNQNLLHNNRFRIGIAQKALNLYLKYLWCLGRIATPPHCPFDNGIIAKLPLTDDQKQRLKWTTLDSLADYQQLVNAAMQKIEQTGHRSLSDWELEEWTPQ